SLPAGITLSSNGLLSGTPTATGNFNIAVTTTDDDFYTRSQAYTLRINCPTLSLSPATLANGTVGIAYNQTISASGGTSPYSFAVNSGTLPTGLTLSSSGALSGTPTAAGSYSFTVTATDANGCTGSQAYTVIICGTITLSPAT